MLDISKYYVIITIYYIHTYCIIITISYYRIVVITTNPTCKHEWTVDLFEKSFHLSFYTTGWGVGEGGQCRLSVKCPPGNQEVEGSNPIAAM